MNRQNVAISSGGFKQSTAAVPAESQIEQLNGSDGQYAATLFFALKSDPFLDAELLFLDRGPRIMMEVPAILRAHFWG